MAIFRPLRSPITRGNTLTTSYPNGISDGYIEIDGVQVFSFERPGFTNDNKSSYFEYAEILNSYLDVTFDGTYTSQVLDCEIYFEQRDGATVLFSVTQSFLGTAGYSLYTEGANVVYSSNTDALSTTTLYVPEGVAGYIPYLDAINGQITYQSFSTTATSATVNLTQYTINRICEPRYDYYKVTFVNRFGVLQDIYFYLVRRDSSMAKSETYKAHVTTPTGSYDISNHSKQTFNVVGNDKLTLNTTFLDESYNDVLNDLMLSEKIWITENGQVLPIRITTQTLDKKTSVNDKLIQYTLEFEYAFDRINNIA